mmetsp:Transcript_59345/g.167182  ORF Transcript_59345/g.167182 Transcript_59345/m.167182 type:complete len:350 (-) Transcript_59345:57-1106(-)
MGGGSDPDAGQRASGGSVPPLPFVDHTWTSWAQCGVGYGNGGGKIEGWALLSPPFAAGETVAFDQKSNMLHCHAEVLADDPDAGGGGGAGSRDDGKQLVRDLDDGTVARVKLKRLARVLPATSPRVLVVADTLSYRRLAKTQPGRRDAVLEVGSCDGSCTHILTCHAGLAVGIDISQSVIDESRRSYPECRFEWLDCFAEPDRMVALIRELRARGELKIFVDIGGNRPIADVCRMLSAVGAAADAARNDDGTAAAPALVVVKSIELAAAATKFCDVAGTITDPAAFWGYAAVQPPPASELQCRKKGARMRAAKWADHPLHAAWLVLWAWRKSTESWARRQQAHNRQEGG